ncbi:hypothetical protein NMT95_24545, partial [Escherichia coli]|nr:hypothetical protein [Escherichia coli]
MPGETFGRDVLTQAGRRASSRHWFIAFAWPRLSMLLTIGLFLMSAGAIYLACEYFVNGIE